MPTATRTLPNIAICGVPGTGKSTLASSLVAKLRTLPEYASAKPAFRVLNGGTEAEKRGCRIAYDDQLQTWEIDEHKLRESLQEELRRGACIVDWIHADFLVAETEDDEDEAKEDHIDLVIQMRAGTACLFDRMKARGYSDKKIEENLDAEIMDEIGEEVRDAFEPQRCVVLQGEAGQGEGNLSRLLQWLAMWRAQHLTRS